MIYAGYLALMGRFAADYDDIVRSFPITSILFAVICLISFITRTREPLETVSVPFFALWLASTVVLLNSLRHKNAAALGVKFHLVNLAIIAAVALMGFAVSSHAFISACGAALLWLWRHLLSPLLMAFAMLLVGIGWGLVKLFGFLFPDRAKEENEEFFQMAVSSAEQMYQQVEGGDSKLFQAVITAIGIALFIGLAVFVIANVVKRRTPPRSDSLGAVTRESISRQDSRPAQPLLRGSPRQQVRHAFRRFMQMCAQMGEVRPGDASDRVCDVYRGSISDPDPESLREIWLQARYSGHEITAADARRARESLSALRAARRGAASKK